MYIYGLNTNLCLNTWKMLSEKSGFYVSLLPVCFSGRLSVLKKILNEFSVLMHKKEIHTSFLFIDDYSKADNEG